MKTSALLSAVALVLLATTVTCKDDDSASDEGSNDDSPDQAGAACEVADDCYPDVDHADLSGPAQCLDRVREGYCTHQCSDDADCCAAEGECVSDLPQVCSPFESTGMMMCFLSCENAEVESTDAADDQEFCQHEVSADFICRSSGGGNQNRKVCVPGDCGVGADCGSNDDCAPDLECLDDYNGGYCGTRDCSGDGDCPGDASCVRDGDNTYCARQCAGPSDCTFCRHADHAASCASDAEFVDAGASGSVCIPERA